MYIQLQRVQGSIWKEFFRSGVLQLGAHGAIVSPNAASELLTIDFRGGPVLTLSEAASFAALVRHIATEGGHLEILLPGRYRGRASAGQRSLINYGFIGLFESARGEEWRERVQLAGAELMPADGAAPEYMPLTWIARQNFVTDVVRLNVRNKLKPEVIDAFGDSLDAALRVRAKFVDALLDMAYLELGENAVLHSAATEGEGSGVICGLVRKDKNADRLECYVVDAGRGIQASLSDTYEFSGVGFHNEPQWNRASAIIRYALEGGSRRYLQERSARMAFRSDVDSYAQRGLARLTRQTQEGDLFQLTSGGHTVEVEGGRLLPEIRLANTAAKHAPFGVRAVVSLQVARKISIDVPTPARIRAAPVRPEVLTVVDPVTGYLRSTPDVLSDPSFKKTAPHLVMDVGYADERPEQVMDIIVQALASKLLPEFITLWNCRTPATEYRYICNRVPLLQDTSLVVVENLHLVTTIQPSFRGAEGSSSTSSREQVRFGGLGYVDIQRSVNSEFLTRGIAAAAGRGGFYDAPVQLASGRVVDRFFSVPGNASANMLSNGNRWAVTAAALLHRLAEQSNIAVDRLKVVAFSNSMSPVVQQLGTDPQFGGRLWLWQPYASPTRADFERFLGPQDHVALLTDAITTGTLKDAVATAVEAVGVRLIGTAALVDAADGQARSYNEEIHGNLVTGASFPVRFLPENAKSEAVYPLRRFSAIPERSDPVADHRVPDRVAATIELITHADAALTGHFTDGARHTTVLVRTDRLVAQLTQQDLRSSLQIHEAENGNSSIADFGCPSVILYPARPTNVLSFPLTRSPDAAGVLAHSIRDNFFPHVPVIEISRLRDADGASRCLIPSQTETEPARWDSVLIVDDGLSTGETAKQLIQISVDRGATAVVAFALLARASLSDVAWWESLYSLQLDRGSVGVRFVLPLVLPIPFYTPETCPVHSSTRMLLRARHESDPIGAIANDMLDRFHAKSMEDEAYNLYSAEFRQTWVDIRTTIALAQEEELPVYLLRDKITELENPQKLSALFQLLLHEQALLDHSVLRRDVVPLIVEKIGWSLTNYPEEPDLVRDALALLRARSTRDFLITLSDNASKFVRNWKILGECAVHVDTVPPQMKTEKLYHRAVLELRQLTTALQRRSAGMIPVAGRPWLGLLTWLYLEASRRPKTDLGRSPASLARELQAVLADTLIHHDIVEKLETYERLTATVGDLDASTYGLYYMTWVSQYLPKVMREIVPYVSALRSPLLVLAADRTDFGDERLRFLTTGGRETGTIETMLLGIGTSLEFMGTSGATQDLRHRMAVVVERLAANLLDGLFREDSVIRALLDDSHRNRVKDVVEELRRQLEVELTTRRIRPSISVQGNWSTLSERHVFCSASAIRTFIGNTSMNVAKYGHGSPRRVIIWIRDTGEGGDEPSASITILSQGPLPDSHSGPGAGTTSVRQHIEFFGGQLYDPMERELSTAKWTEQQVLFRLW